MKDNGEWHAVRNNRHDNGAMVMKTMVNNRQW